MYTETTKLRPMLAAKELCEDTDFRKDALVYPLFGSTKLDGIRFLVVNGQVVSRTLKPIRSIFVQQMFGRAEFNGWDGELIFGEPTHAQVFSRTTSAVMTIGCRDVVHAYLFDNFALNLSYRLRLDHLKRQVKALSEDVKKHITVIEQVPVFDWEQVLGFEETVLSAGYEGIILRSPEAPYKFNRSTFREQGLMKLKRILDAEAVVIGFEELMINGNEPVIDALGFTKRSSSKEGKVPSGMLGALIVKDLVMGVEFNIGSGFDDAERQLIWNNKESYLGKVVSYKYFPIGIKDKPRHPIFKGFRSMEDM